MDSNKFSTQVERLSVVETGRRRRWADDEKLKIVAESMETPRAISSTARRYGFRSHLTQHVLFCRQSKMRCMRQSPNSQA
jgi:transposase